MLHERWKLNTLESYKNILKLSIFTTVLLITINNNNIDMKLKPLFISVLIIKC